MEGTSLSQSAAHFWTSGNTGGGLGSRSLVGWGRRHRNGLSAPLGQEPGGWCVSIWPSACWLWAVSHPAVPRGAGGALLLRNPRGHTRHGGKPNVREQKCLLQELPASCRMFLRVIPLSGPSSATGRSACRAWASAAGCALELCPSQW